MGSLPAHEAIGLLRQPKMVLFGAGKRHQLPFILKSFAKTVLLVTDERMHKTSECLEMIVALSNTGINVEVFDEVLPDVPRGNVNKAYQKFRNTKIDAVVGLGGGSCLDMAKVISVVLAHDVDVNTLYGEGLVPGPGFPVITIPTTGGTGAEVTCISVVYDEERKMKLGVASSHLEPYAAIVDPELTLSCPPALTAATGADALTHLVEAFTGKSKKPSPEQIDKHLYVGKNAFADIYARHGIKLLNHSLEAVIANPNDLQARTDTMMGAFAAGMAINTAGTAAAHAIQSPIGGLTHTAHGFGVGALLPYVMRFNLPTRIDEMAEIAETMGIVDSSESKLDKAKKAIRRVEEILTVIRAPIDLKELGVERKDFDFISDQALLATRLVANNPRELTKKAVLEILSRGYNQDLSWWEYSE